MIPDGEKSGGWRIKDGGRRTEDDMKLDEAEIQQ
jgi:hypothetical protein